MADIDVTIDPQPSIDVTIDQPSAIEVTISGASISNFLQLVDTPSVYTGQSLKGLRVNSTEDALEFFTSEGLIDWGEIGGTLADQIDLQAALDLKYDASDFSTDFDIDFATKDTDDLTEGSTNLYDQTVSISGGTNVTIGGTYPNFTLTDNSASSTDLTTHTENSAIHFIQSAISIPASQISDFDTEVSNNTDVTSNTSYRGVGHLPLAGGTMSGEINLDSNKITSLATPTSLTDAANKDYVDSTAQGLNWQESVLDEVNFVTSEPTGQSDGDRYINTTTGTSSATSQAVTADYIYEWNGTSWTETTPQEGFAVWIEDIDVLKVYSGSSWVSFGSTITHNNLSGLDGGVSTEYFHLTSAEHTNLTGVSTAFSALSATTFKTTDSVGFKLGTDDEINPSGGAVTGGVLTMGGDGAGGNELNMVADHGGDASAGDINWYNYRSGSSPKIIAQIQGWRDANNAAGKIIFNVNDNSVDNLLPALTLDKNKGATFAGAVSGITTLGTGKITLQTDTNAKAMAIYGRAADNISQIEFFANDQSTYLFKLDARTDVNNIRTWNDLVIQDSVGASIVTFAESSKAATFGGNVDASTFTTTGTVNAGAVDIAEDGWVGNNYNAGRMVFHSSGTDVITVTDANFATTGSISVDDTTESTSTTTGSIHTDGGLGVEKNVIIGGNVGIGTTSPGSQLEIMGTDSSSFATSGTLTLDVGDSSYGPWKMWVGGTGNYDGALKFGLNSTGQNDFDMTIDKDGDLGIGTLSPDARLHVSADKARAMFDATNNNQRIIISPQYSSLDGYTGLTDANGTLKINSLSSGDVTLAVGGGNVGIGTTTPSRDLSVVGNTGISGYLQINEIKSYNTDHDITIVPNGAGNLLITNGNVGIGTDSPGVSLEVSGSSNQFIKLTTTTAADVGYTASESGTTQFSLFSDTSDSKLRLVNYRAEPIEFSTDRGGTENIAMTILNSGNVGIGTTTPGTSLDVNGAITQRELSADPSDPDEGSSVTWQSDGTDSGDDGDILIKITAGGVTKTVTLIDFSAA